MALQQLASRGKNAMSITVQNVCHLLFGTTVCMGSENMATIGRMIFH
jgi:uncharacterized protein (UPF0261 family)